MARKATTKKAVEARYARFDAWWTVAIVSDELVPAGTVVSVKKVDGEVRQAKVLEAKGMSISDGTPTVFYTYANAK